MSEGHKKYDSQADFGMKNARLAKDPQVIEGGDKPMVKLTFACESRSERHSTMWVECTVNDRQSDLAAALQKGDVICWEGFPALRLWGENNSKFSIECIRTELFPSIELIMKLKERGWVPGERAQSKTPPKAKQVPPKQKAPAKRQVQNLDDDDLEG